MVKYRVDYIPWGRGKVGSHKMSQSKQAEMEARRLEILKKLLERPYTYEELSSLLMQSVRNVKNDIKALQESGYEISKHKKGVGYIISEDKKNEYRKSLEGSETGSGKNKETRKIVYKHVVSEGVEKLIIILTLQKSKGGLSFDDLFDEYIGFADESSIFILSTEERSRFYKNKKETIRARCTELVSDGFINYDENLRVYSIPKNAPVLMNIDMDTVDEYLYAIRAFGATYALGNKLKSVEEKLALISGETLRSEDSNYIIIGSKINNNPRISECLKMFEDIPYDKYAIKMIVKGRTVTIKVGLMVYTADKDKLYIIGKSGKEKYRIIDTEEIGVFDKKGETELAIEVLKDTPNDIYQSEEYIRIYAESFSLSAEPLEHVVVEVKDFGNLKHKFTVLKNQRNRLECRGDMLSAKIYQKDSETFIYEDNIRGMSDFAKYLRRFGRSVKVLEPESLRKMMLDDVARLEEMYRKEGLYE